ncbi:holo-ACP synthase [Rickettsiaceae bacterium]|nr:holo-ACP synthase [Rickettsiaceae bacterium]
MIIGVGTDIVNMDRIKDILSKHGDKFIEKNFHELEREKYSALPESHRVGFLAKRFAGKEAFLKALGVGIGKQIALKDIAIISEDSGAPKLVISPEKLPEIVDYKIQISLSDDAPFAVAFVVVSSYG